MDCIGSCFHFLYRIRARRFNRMRLASAGYRDRLTQVTKASLRLSLRGDVVARTFRSNTYFCLLCHVQ